VPETFIVTAYAGSIKVNSTVVVALAPGASITFNWVWNTAGVTAGTYKVKGTASAVPGEVDLADNVRWDGTIEVVVHDVAVTYVTASPLEAVQGKDVVTIVATVQNKGTCTETLAVNAYAGLNLVGYQLVTLPPGQAANVTFYWSTAGVPPGSYQIKVVVGSVVGEVNLANNVYVDGTVRVVVHDLAVIDVSASPSEVAPGGIVTIEVTVQNQGSVTETFVVSVTANGQPITPVSWQMGTLAPGAVGVYTFNWDTTGWSLSNYIIWASVSTVPGEQDTVDNNWQCGYPCVSIVVHDVAVQSVAADLSQVPQGQTVTITVVVENQGSVVETFDVKVFANSVEIDRTTVTVAPAGSYTVMFYWDTHTVPPGDYVISATAGPVPGETDLADNTKVGNTVTVT
jgi:hypothetical protein